MVLIRIVVKQSRVGVPDPDRTHRLLARSGPCGSSLCLSSRRRCASEPGLSSAWKVSREARKPSMPVSPSANPLLSWLRLFLGPGLMELLSHLLFRAVTEDSYTDKSAEPSCLSTRCRSLNFLVRRSCNVALMASQIGGRRRRRGEAKYRSRARRRETGKWQPVRARSKARS